METVLKETILMSFDNFEDFLPETYDVIKIRKKGGYINLSCAYDSETTSIYADDKKFAFVYMWALAIGNIIIRGRQVEEFVNTINRISYHYGLCDDKMLVIYVHNLAFDISFLMNNFLWKTVFADGPHKPLKATTLSGVEFRCSMRLTNDTLENVGKSLVKHNIQKLKGDLDYNVVRHYKTEITEKEWEYQYNDVRVLKAFIDEQIEIEGDITKIPMTKTGYVRRFVKQRCIPQVKKNTPDYEGRDYRNLMSTLTIEVDEYKMLKQCFQGGFTHASLSKSGIVNQDVASYDFTSSYPAVMLAEMYPMGKGEIYMPKNLDDFTDCIKTYCCMFEIKFTGIQLKDTVFDTPISLSRCITSENPVVDNGRVFAANEITMVITEQDFLTIRACYNFKEFKIGKLIRYHKDYLPKHFVECILYLYGKKTELKDVVGEESNYQLLKGMLNSLYGMCVTDICKSECSYEDYVGWIETENSLEETINEYNNNKQRFLSYPWGVWVTAYARRNLFSGILACGKDYIYSDTDSVKILNHEKHSEYFQTYNENITDKIRKCLEKYQLDINMMSPKTIKGKVKPIGVWDFEGVYSKFKTLGAKRYMYENDSGLHITIAGVSKKSGAAYLSSFDDPFKAFDYKLEFSGEHSGKLTHTYIDTPITAYVTDYNGVTVKVTALSGVHLEPASYNMSCSQEYETLLKMRCL